MLVVVPVAMSVLHPPSQQSFVTMNVTRYLKDRKDKTSRQIVFKGERLDMQAVWKLRDRFFPPRGGTTR